jgi:PTH1 family peptidyl-tRNA hydrolase
MFLIVGLGNPGGEYQGTRHNAGFMAIDAIAENYKFSSFKAKFDGLIADGVIEGEKCLLLKPQTYMNLSGNSVIKAASFYKILPENIIVIHDDMDLQPNQIKAKIGGGAGGHNGLKSIDSHIGANYNRIRLGVGHPKGSGEVVVNHVLSRFSKTDAELLQNNINIVVKNISVLIKKDVGAFCNSIALDNKKASK